MLKKLYKHEFHSLFRLMLPIYAGLLVMAGLTRLLQLLPSNLIVDFLKGSTVVLYVLAILGMYMLTMIIVVTRFYKNLLSKEGYLTFSLPVRAADHLNCKLVCSIIVLWLTVVMMCVSLIVVFLATNGLADFFDGVRYFFEYMAHHFNALQLVVMAVEFFLAVLAATAYGILMFYGSMCIGQLFKKRIASAVLFGFIIYSTIQTFSVVMLSILVELGLDDWLAQINFTPFGAVCSILGVVIVWEGLLAGILYGFSRYLLSKKLNLQ
ncbi:MAG: hypothetical protein MJ132_07410 [Clostridia bacterium]|nr:hypothetical protein [Clostridia bacterium]